MGHFQPHVAGHMTRLRIAKRTEKLANGTTVVRRKVVEAPELEWKLQASQVRALTALPEYGRDFLLVGGMEAGRRGMQESVKAKATGLTAGHPDLTIFIRGGRCGFIENKSEKGSVSDAQRARHAALIALGFDVVIIRASSESEAADAAVSLVRSWIVAPANDN